MLFCNDNVKFIKMYCITLKDQTELTVNKFQYEIFVRLPRYLAVLCSKLGLFVLTFPFLAAVQQETFSDL